MAHRNQPTLPSILLAIATWGFAILVAASPALLAQASSSMEKWTPVYLAGGMGGLVLELLLSRHQLEFPSYAPSPEPQPAATRKKDDDEEEDEDEADEADAMFGSPYGPRVDIGFLGRFFTAGLAAVALIILGAVVIADKSLGNLTNGTDYQTTIGWAIAIGASSPAVWRAFQAMVEARVGKVRRQYIKQLSEEKEKGRTRKKVARKTTRDLKTVRAGARRKGPQSHGSKERSYLLTQSQIKEQLEVALQKPPPSEDKLEEETRVYLDIFSNVSLLPEETEELEAEQQAALDRAIGALELIQEL